jgi:tripartite-type tricarboxylate transporter receptor subunit TctC
MMKYSIPIIVLVLVAFGLSIGIPDIQAQPYPNRPVQLIDSFDPGTTGDITGRHLAEELTKILGTQVIVVNKPGASMNIGADAVAKSKKDGYTIGYTAGTAMIYSKASNPGAVPYDPFKDLEPLGVHVFFSNVLAVQESSPWKTFAEFIDYAKKNPGRIRVGTIGMGSTPHYCLALMETLTGTQFTHIPLKGGQLVVTSILGGHLEAIMTAPSQILPHIKVGKVRALLVSKRAPQLPDIPTMVDLGYKQDLLSAFFALYAPAGIAEEAKEVLVPAIEKAVKAPEMKPKMEKLGFVVEYRSPAEHLKLMKEEYEMACTLAKKIGLRKE